MSSGRLWTLEFTILIPCTLNISKKGRFDTLSFRLISKISIPCSFSQKSAFFSLASRETGENGNSFIFSKTCHWLKNKQNLMSFHSNVYFAEVRFSALRSACFEHETGTYCLKVDSTGSFIKSKLRGNRVHCLFRIQRKSNFKASSNPNYLDVFKRPAFKEIFIFLRNDSSSSKNI